mgnify:FL=1
MNRFRNTMLVTTLLLLGGLSISQPSMAAGGMCTVTVTVKCS